MPDSKYIGFGNSNDLQIYHDGTNSIIKNTQGQTRLVQDYFAVRNGADNEYMIYGQVNSSVELYFDGSKKFNTTNDGGTLTGNLFVSEALQLNDSKKIELGNSADLQIYHDGSNSRIKDVGTGVLAISGSEVHIQNNNNSQSIAKFLGGSTTSSVELYYDDSKKFSTTSYGIQVGSGGGSVFSGLSNYQAYFGFDATSSNSFGGIVLGSGPNGNSPFIAASKAGDSTGLNLGLRTNGSVRLLIQNNGNIGAPSGNNIYNASDERLKENMVELTDGLSKINQIKPYSFTWKSGFDKNLEGVTQYGFGAHQTKSVDEVLVEPFCEEDIELNGETIENPLRVNEKFIIPMLVKAMQELSAKVETLETKVAALEAA